jgi:hypothetical protein
MHLSLSAAKNSPDDPDDEFSLATVSAADFAGGAPWSYTHRGRRTTILFTDDIWYPLDRMPVDGTKARFKIDFGGLDEWLKSAAKHFIAHQWLECRKSAQQLKLMQINFLRFQGILGADRGPDAHGSGQFKGPVGSLNRFHGERVSSELVQKARLGAQIQRAMMGKPMRQFQKALRSAEALVPETVIRMAGHLNAFAAWLRSSQSLDTDFEVRLPAEVSDAMREIRDLGAHPTKIISDSVLATVLAACANELSLLDEAEAAVAADRQALELDTRLANRLEVAHSTKRMWAAYNRAVKAQAVRLQFLAARRRTSVATLPLSPKIETPEESVEGHKVIYIWFTTYKWFGDEGAPERIPFPGFMAEEALDALRVAGELTSRVRADAALEDASRLFLVRGKSGVRSMNGNDLQSFLNSTSKNAPGLIQRYDIKGADGLTSHHVRHTNATRIVEAGGSVTLAARYLGHTVSADDGLFAWLFYVAGNTPEGRERMVTEMAAGAASGTAFNAVARVAIELAGGHASTPGIPPNQLSYEEALQRLRNFRLIEEDDITEEHLRRRLSQGYALNATRYGGCFLQATSGPCLTPEKCVVGVDPESQEVQDGEGCPHQVLMPHGLEFLREEAALMEIQISFFEQNGNYAFWLARERRQLEIWRKQIARAEALEAMMPGDSLPAPG